MVTLIDTIQDIDDIQYLANKDDINFNTMRHYNYGKQMFKTIYGDWYYYYGNAHFEWENRASQFISQYINCAFENKLKGKNFDTFKFLYEYLRRR